MTAGSLNNAVFARRDETIGVAVVCTVRAGTVSPRVTCEAVRDRLVLLAEKVVTGRPVHVLELVVGEEATATLLLADEDEVRAADVRSWMADACSVPADRITVTKFVGTHAVIGVPADEPVDWDENGRLRGWWRDAGA